MNAKNAGPLILIFALVLVGIANIRIISGSFTTQQPIAAQKNTEKRGTIAWLVKRAKEQNKTKLFVPPPEESYAEVNGLEDASSLYTTLVVQPVQQKTVVLNDSSLITWHKLKVIELISYPARNCSNCVSSLTAPQEMLPLQADEVLVPTYGGTLEVDGVQLESRTADFGEQFDITSCDRSRSLCFLPDRGYSARPDFALCFHRDVLYTSSELIIRPSGTSLVQDTI